MALTYNVNGINVTYLGRTAFAVNSLKLQSEVQWGLDGLQRSFIGAAPLLEDFINSLNKGDSIDYAGDTYYLIDWAPDGDKLWPTVTLNYLGESNGTPPPVGDDSWAPQSATITAQISVPDPETDAGEVAVLLTRQVDYLACQTTWRYITTTRPTGAVVGITSTGYDPIVLRSVITAESESHVIPIGGDLVTHAIFAGQNAPAAYVSATFPAVVNTLMDLNVTEIYATPFFECQETIARLYFG